MGRLKDLTGMRFGRLVVLEKADNYRHYTAYPNGKFHLSSYPRWRCRCDCGKETIVMGGNLKTGQTQSCGCLQRELLSERHRK